MITVTVIYTMTNVALYTAISPVEMLDSPAVAVVSVLHESAQSKSPAQEFAHKLYGKFAFIMPIFVACSTIGSANGVILTSSRLFYAGAREGHMPQLLTMINERTLTPMPAVIFTGLLSLGYLALSNNVFSLINYIQIVTFLAIGTCIVALLYLRRIMPDAPRAVKVGGIW
jgi:amino acid transporter